MRCGDPVKTTGRTIALLVNLFGLHSPPLAALVTRGSEPNVSLTGG